MENTFTNRHTNSIKGCAVMLLLFHHLFYKMEYFDECFTFFSGEAFLYNLIARLSRVCVAMFLLLSGYGLVASADKKKDVVSLRFAFSHVFKIIFSFWAIYLIFVPLGLFFDRTPATVYGTGISDITNFLYDFLGIAYLTETPTFNVTWWFMGEILRIYILFPIMYYGVKHNSLLTFFIGIVGIIYNFVWFLPFICGMIIAKENLFARYMELHFLKKLSILLIGLVVVPIRVKFDIKADALFSLWVCLFVLSFIKPGNILGRLFEFLGKHSGNIFMLHTFIYHYYFNNFIYSFYHPIIIFIVLLLLCIGISWIIEQLKEMTPYNRLGNFVQDSINKKSNYKSEISI